MIHETTKRVIYTDGDCGNDKEKFIIKKEYKEFGIYQNMCPSGIYVNNFWLITDGDVYLEIFSYSNYCMEEILDLIDNYTETGEFGVKGFVHYDDILNRNIYYIHDSGVEI